MFTDTQLKLLKALPLEGRGDRQSHLAALADKLMEDEHPLGPLVARAYKWETENPLTAHPSLATTGVEASLRKNFRELGPRRSSRSAYLPGVGHMYVGSLTHQKSGNLVPGLMLRPDSLASPDDTVFRAPATRAEMAAVLRHLRLHRVYPKEPLKESEYPFIRPEEPTPDQLSREQPVTPGKIADALQDAAKEESQKTYGAVYVSPSTREGSTFQHALAEFGKGPHSEILKQGERFGPSYPMLGVWADGAEEGALVETDPALVKKVGALLALKHKQKAFAAFTPNPGASGGQHVLELQEPWPVDRLHQYIQSKGVEYGTFLPTQHDPRLIEVVHVLTGSPEESQHTHDALAPLGKHHFTPGNAEIVGAATRGEATALYRKLLGG